MIKILPFFLILLSNAFAQEMVVETYCFQSEQEALKARESAKYMMLPSDRTEPKESCFSVFTHESRRELIQKYLLNSFPKMRVDYSSSETTSKDDCQLLVEKVKIENKESIFLQSGKNPQGRVRESTKSTREVSQLRVMSGAPFELKVDEQEISGKCRYITPSRYEITFTMRFVPKPIVPEMAPGTTVVINNPSQIKHQTGTNLATTVQMNKGEKLEIGNIVKDLTNEAAHASLIPKIQIDKSKGEAQEKIYLMIK